MTTTTTVYQTPVFGATEGYRPVFTMEDMPHDAHEDMFALNWLFGALNDYERMAAYSVPATMRSLSVGDIVCMDRGSLGSVFYKLSPMGWSVLLQTGPRNGQ